MSESIAATIWQMEFILTVIAFLLFAILAVLYTIGKQFTKGYDDGRGWLTILEHLQRLNKENLDKDEDEWRKPDGHRADWMGRIEIPRIKFEKMK